LEADTSEPRKNAVLAAKEGDTMLSLKELTPVRLLKNPFYQQVQKAMENCATKEELEELLGRGRAKLGMFEGQLVDGELEIGQVSSYIKELIPAGALTQQIWNEFVNKSHNLYK
jgi:enoyl-[acyl-carrier protein] reductase II